MRSAKDRQGLALIAGVVVALAGLLAASFVFKPPNRDSRNCVGTPHRRTVIVLDRTDSVSLQTLAEIRSRALAYVRDSTLENELVSIFPVDADAQTHLAPVVSLCRLPSTGSAITQNVKSVEADFQEKFVRPIDSVLSAPPHISIISPLGQILTDLSEMSELHGDTNTLIVFSDMLENSSTFSLYHCSSPERVIADYRASRLGATERPKFRNTAVHLNIIPRYQISSITLKCRDRLWPWFFGDNSGPRAGVDVANLPGGPTR